MMEHQEASRQLFAFLDGELTPAGQLAVVKHLASCAACRRRLEYDAAVKALVWEKVGHEVAPSSLRQRIITEIEHLEARPRLWQRLNAPVSVRPIFGLALAALLMLLASMPALLQYRARDGRISPIFDQVAGKHTVFATERNTIEVAGDEAEIAEWYKGRGVLVPSVPQPAGLELLGARLSDLHDDKAVHLIYELSSKYVSLFIFKGLEGDFPASWRHAYRGEEFYPGKWARYNIVLWRQGEMGYAVVADMERDKLLETAYEMRMDMEKKGSRSP